MKREMAEPGRKGNDQRPDDEEGGGSTGTLRKAGIALAVIGGAALVASAVTGGIANGKSKDLAEVCEGSVCDTQYGGLLENRDNLAVTTDVLWISGAAIALAGIVLAVVDSPDEKKSLDKPSDRKGTFIASPSLAPGHAGVVAEWRF